MMTEEQMAAARLFAAEHPAAAMALVMAVNGVTEASTTLTAATGAMSRQFDAMLSKISELERRVAALEGVAGLGDLG